MSAEEVTEEERETHLSVLDSNDILRIFYPVIKYKISNEQLEKAKVIIHTPKCFINEISGKYSHCKKIEEYAKTRPQFEESKRDQDGELLYPFRYGFDYIEELLNLLTSWKYKGVTVDKAEFRKFKLSFEANEREIKQNKKINSKKTSENDIEGAYHARELSAIYVTDDTLARLTTKKMLGDERSCGLFEFYKLLYTRKLINQDQLLESKKFLEDNNEWVSPTDDE